MAEEKRIDAVAMGRLAVTRGWINLKTLAHALRRLAEGEPPEEVWVGSGVLSEERFASLLQEVERSGGDLEEVETIAHGATLLHYKGTSQEPGVEVEASSSHSLAETMSGASSSGESFALPREVGVLSHGRERYLIEEQLGRGGSGRVYRAFDRALGRLVALKVMRANKGKNLGQRAQRFIAEARITSKLDHPNIMPIYDVGVLPTGEVYYTMKLLRRQSLRRVLRRVDSGEAEAKRDFGSTRLLQIFLSICQAMAYAHSRGVVHRDLKPDNIMLGEYGEVLVTDWGLARALGDPVEVIEEGGGPATLGTPAYMPPEQALGRLDKVDELSDVYSLGAILYEMLSFHAPHEGMTPLDILDAVVGSKVIPPSDRAGAGEVPRELEEICLKALSHERTARHQSSRELYEEVLAFVDHTPLREARSKLARGSLSSQEYFQIIEEAEGLSAEVRRLREEILPSQPIDEKRQLWQLEDRLERARMRIAQAYSDSVRAFTQALTFKLTSEDARRGLADLYWSRFQLSSSRGEVLDQVHYSALLKQMDAEGRFHDLLVGSGGLELESDPPGARVTLFKYRELNRVLVSWRGESIGETPVSLSSLEMGSYLAIVELPGYQSVRYPFEVTRCGVWRGRVRLLAEGSCPQGMVYVPGGPARLGGDPRARNAGPPRVEEVPGFFISRDPVTFGEYLEYLDDLQSRDPEEALIRAPQARDGDGAIVEYRDGRWRPLSILIEGESRQRYPEGEGHESRLPVLCVSATDAAAYALWKAERSGIPYRLVEAREWEKAGRGVDGRSYPWGDRFDATFCKMRLSRGETPQPEPVGAFKTDMSVYGVRDMAGGLQEWCRDDRWEGTTHPESVRVCGGAWTLHEDGCRLANRMEMLGVGRAVWVGFRLASDIPSAAE